MDQHGLGQTWRRRWGRRTTATIFRIFVLARLVVSDRVEALNQDASATVAFW
jgi:hypothetical protein